MWVSLESMTYVESRDQVEEEFPGEQGKGLQLEEVKTAGEAGVWTELGDKMGKVVRRGMGRNCLATAFQHIL